MSSDSENVKDHSAEVNKTSEKTDETASEDVSDKDTTTEIVEKSIDKKEDEEEEEEEDKEKETSLDKSLDAEKSNEEEIDAKKETKSTPTENKLKDTNEENCESKMDVDNDEGEDSDNDKKEVPLLDQPLEQSGTRERKKVKRFNDRASGTDTKEVKTDIPIGTGIQLGEIPRIDASISRFKNDDLKLLHRLLYKTPGKTALIKKNIKKFNGFEFMKDSDEYLKKIDSTKKFELKQLKSICEMLDLEKKGSKDEIVERVVDFLLVPKDSGKAVGGGRPKRTAAVRANNRGYSSHDDSYSSDERRIARGGRGKGKRSNLKDETTSESDEEFHPSDTSDTKSRTTNRKKGGRKKQESEEEIDDDVSEVDESATSEDSDDEPKKRKKNKKVVNNKGKGKPGPKPKGRKPAAESEKKATPKKRGRKRERPPSEESEQDEIASSSEDEPLIKKTKSPQPPTDEEIKKYVKEILDGANLEEITMKTVCKQVYAHYPDFDLVHKKDFIKNTVKSLIST